MSTKGNPSDVEAGSKRSEASTEASSSPSPTRPVSQPVAESTLAAFGCVGIKLHATPASQSSPAAAGNDSKQVDSGDSRPIPLSTSPAPPNESPKNGQRPRRRSVAFEEPKVVPTTGVSLMSELRQTLERCSPEAVLDFAVAVGAQLCEKLGVGISVDLSEGNAAITSPRGRKDTLANNGLTSPIDLTPSSSMGGKTLTSSTSGRQRASQPTQFTSFSNLRSILQQLDESSTSQTSFPRPRLGSSASTESGGLGTTVNFTTRIAAADSDDGFAMMNSYMILQELGHGKYGIVLLAADTDHADRMVAIKVLPRSILNKRLFVSETPGSSAASSARSSVSSSSEGLPADIRPLGAHAEPEVQRDPKLLREVAVMKKIKHKSVVRLYEVIDDPAEAKVYLVMQYIERGPLLQFDDKQRCTALDAEMAVTYMRQLLDALQYLHDKKIVHSDIKPDNILLGNNGRAYLADFGVSSMVEQSATRSADDDGRLMIHGGDGTPAFMAPEVIGGATSYDGAAADIWALGVTFYAMLFGHLPFAATSYSALRKSIIEDDVEFNADVLEDESDEVAVQIRDFISRMLEKNPLKRMRAEELLDHDFVAVAGAPPRSTTQKQGTAKPRTPTTKRSAAPSAARRMSKTLPPPPPEGVDDDPGIAAAFSEFFDEVDDDEEAAGAITSVRSRAIVSMSSAHFDKALGYLRSASRRGSTFRVVQMGQQRQQSVQSQQDDSLESLAGGTEE